MKRCASALQEKISFFLKWNPLGCVYSGSISKKRLQIFSKFQQKVLAGNLQHVYMIVASYSLVILLVDIIYWAGLEENLRPTNFRSLYVLGLSLANAGYHGLLFVLLRVKTLKKKILRIIGLLDAFSLFLLQMFFGYHLVLLAANNSLITLTVGLAVAIFANSVTMLYFQDSFALSMFFWIAETSLACYGALSSANGRTANFDSVVSC